MRPDLLAAHLVGDAARQEDEGDVDNEHDGSDRRRVARRVVQRRLQVVRKIREHRVEAHGVQHAGTERDEQHPEMLGEQRANGMLHLLAHFLHTLLHLGVHRGILQMGTDVVGDVAQGKRQPERDAPAPIDDEGRIGAPNRKHERGQKRAHEQACCRRSRHHRAVEPAMVMRRVLRDKGGSASILARRRERLHHAQQQKQKRGPHADDGIAGQTSDQEGRTAHQQDGHQRPFATLLVAHVAPENRADGTHEERERRTRRRCSSPPRHDLPVRKNTMAITVAK